MPSYSNLTSFDSPHVLPGRLQCKRSPSSHALDPLGPCDHGFCHSILSTFLYLILLLIIERIGNLLTTIERTYEDEKSTASDDEAERPRRFVAFII